MNNSNLPTVRIEITQTSTRPTAYTVQAILVLAKAFYKRDPIKCGSKRSALNHTRLLQTHLAAEGYESTVYESTTATPSQTGLTS
jgi:hypothetical protein